MAEQKRSGSRSGDSRDDGASPMDRLRDEFTDFLDAQAQHLTDKLGDSLTGLTGKLQDAAENGGTLPRVGARMLQGDSPAKAMVAEKAKDIKDGVVGKAKDLFSSGGGGGGKAGDTKVTNIVEVVDVGVPLRTVYDQWTQYEEFSSFTKGVRSVSASDEVSSDWKVKVGPSSRSWKATVQEQLPDDRIVWTSEGSKGSTRGAVSFHELAPTLTRIVVVVEYYPAGFFEKTGNLWRAQGRRLRLDLKHFARYVTLNADEEVEGWRGEIRDGEVVRSHEEGLEDDEAYDDPDSSDEGADEDEDEYDAEDDPQDQDEAADSDEDYDAEDEEYEDDEAEDDDEAGARPARRR
ncbi:SRPBCC family protein [Streptomyces sp. SID14478]|uniref:SRPBCC family protein n=1 Tax=Streptomyces sp. SID14478 TaxID=2706073 RepID=UPI0013DFF7B7|nr:SRPBCC family protein [Streptomyces sp. SID14478]NEB81956.1 SRPBCC family protein [Streptomyces sp. SID14478]